MNYKDLFVEKYRPTTLDDIVLDERNMEYFSKLLKSKNIPNLLLYGKPGGGKTTLARVIAKELGWEKLELNASDENGVDAIREKVYTFCNTASLDGEKKLVIFEEADGLSSAGGNGSSAQQILKNLIEESSDTVRFIMTVNDIYKMDAAIKSRMECINIVPPKGLDEAYKSIMRRLYAICKAEGITFDYDKNSGITSLPLYRIAKDFYPDMRKMVDSLQRYSANEEHKLVYAGNETKSVEEIALNVINGLICKFNALRADSVRPEDINKELVALRSYVISVEDSFGADYHRVMKEMVMALVDRRTENIGDDSVLRECVLEIQDRMKWYSMVLDKELHFFAMMISLAKILKAT